MGDITSRLGWLPVRDFALDPASSPDHGRHSPTRESGVHHFHRLLCEILADTTDVE
jgi:hypothetical protein